MGNFIVNLLNALIELVALVLRFLINILPDSPFQIAMDSSAVQSAIGNWNWFFPITEILATLQAWLSAIVIYYIIVVPMRYVKLIGSD